MCIVRGKDGKQESSQPKENSRHLIIIRGNADDVFTDLWLRFGFALALDGDRHFRFDGAGYSDVTSCQENK
jgi:hypothetical protein